MGTDLREEINNSAELCQLRPVGSPAGVEPLVWRRAVQGRIEGHLMAVEALMSALDSMDSDPDLEPDSDYELQGDEEYSLGWTCKEVSTGRYVSQGYHGGDLEYEHDGLEPDCDKESNGDYEEDHRGFPVELPHGPRGS
ncbi:hypothetical protein [Devosia nitrariae]|uniref:Uncharacterized protein n=1 Tax=Devosia nitrariae TaxID=2071872 RepID=A0ABQ5W8X0_9HYPH|nr:hypothetical protein [Devosia nitrariae]GLQ56216.1 hypothetical protein GCM10010862_34750 [Devosia nitrariae]